MTAASDVLRELFEYHAWATVSLLEAIERLGPETLDSKIDGTYGSVAETLTHLVDSDDRYLQRMREPRPPAYVDHGRQTPEVLRERVRTNEGRWNRLLDELDAGELDVTIADREALADGRHTEALLFLQALHHGNDHRTQVCSTLGALGLEVPDIDGWSYWPTRSP